MGKMLLRTSKHKIALCLKLVCFLSVVAVFVIFRAVKKIEKKEGLLPDSKVSVNANIFKSRHLLALIEEQDNCTPPSILDFPDDGFTREERQGGWIFVHVLLACYCFILLALVCDDYFIPAVKQLSESMNLQEDITGATFMATASSSSELFINCVGTFVTEGDLGVGTIVGSAVFNILAVPACCGLFSNMAIDLEWWPISRDCMVYGISVVLLIGVMQDGRIYVYEALALVLVYVLYIIIMCFNSHINSAANRVVSKFKLRRKKHYTEIITESHPLLLKIDKNCNGNCIQEILGTELTLKDCEELEDSTKIWQWPSESSPRGKIWWLITWPISFLLNMTIPVSRKFPKMYFLTFIMCVCWIGCISYIVAWLITAVGDTLNIPDSVMGLTFLAAGTSVPEAVSSIIVANQGYGGMGISSSIGSNTFDILLCLGIPWLIKTSFYPKIPGKHWIQIHSAGLNYSALSLLSTLLLFYLSVSCNKFRLDWKIIIMCFLMYGAFLTFASMLELNVFFSVNLPTCDH